MAEDEQVSAREELAVIARRIRFVYYAITAAVTSGLFVCLLIAGAFMGAFVRVTCPTPSARCSSSPCWP